MFHNVSELSVVTWKEQRVGNLNKKEQDQIKEWQLNLLSSALQFPEISQSTIAVLHFDRLKRNLADNVSLLLCRSKCPVGYEPVKMEDSVNCPVVEDVLSDGDSSTLWLIKVPHDVS